MSEALRRWGVPSGSHALLIVNEMTEPLLLSSRNIPTLKVTAADRLIVSDILRADCIVMESSALQYIQVLLNRCVDFVLLTSQEHVTLLICLSCMV